MTPFKKFLRGNSFSGTVYFAPRTGEPNSLIGYTAVSKILDAAGNRHSADTCEISQDGLSILVKFNGETTASLAKGMAKWNVMFQYGDDTSTAFSTGVFEFEVTDNPSL